MEEGREDVPEPLTECQVRVRSDVLSVEIFSSSGRGHPFGVPGEERYIKSATGGYIPGRS